MELETIDTRDYRAVGETVFALGNAVYPDLLSEQLIPWFDRVAQYFGGELPGYQAMDTKYHDLDHTMQATLCFARLVTARHRVHPPVEPVLQQRDFIVGVVATLFHDLGYLKAESDRNGTGAKFTHLHEARSATMAEMCLQRFSWPLPDIVAVRHLIQCTGPKARIDRIPFLSDAEQVIGLAVCTADYLGQMSDPRYLQKLQGLFLEFEECDDYRGIPKQQRQFQSAEEMLQKTPAFWQYHVLPKLNGVCQGLHKFLCDPYPDGQNPYIVAILRHLRSIPNTKTDSVSCQQVG